MGTTFSAGDRVVMRGEEFEVLGDAWTYKGETSFKARPIGADRRVPARTIESSELWSYIVKLSGSRMQGRSVDGEYDGGKTLEAARVEAKTFVPGLDRGRVSIVRSSACGLYTVEVEVVAEVSR